MRVILEEAINSKSDDNNPYELQTIARLYQIPENTVHDLYRQALVDQSESDLVSEGKLIETWAQSKNPKLDFTRQFEKLDRLKTQLSTLLASKPQLLSYAEKYLDFVKQSFTTEQSPSDKDLQDFLVNANVVYAIGQLMTLMENYEASESLQELQKSLKTKSFAKLAQYLKNFATEAPDKVDMIQQALTAVFG